MFRYVLFDFDGTVFDTGEGIMKSVRYAVNKVGIDAPLEELRCFVGPPLGETFSGVFGFSAEQSEQAIRDFRERYIPIGLYESHVFPAVPALLRELKNGGCALAVATSKPQALAEKLLESVGISELFDAVRGGNSRGDDVGKEVVTRRAMEMLGAKPSETVLVGDTKYDVAGAHACGIPCIGVRWGYAAAGELETAGADYIAESTDEVKEFCLYK